MSRPLESFEFLNRGWGIRFLEGQSLRWAFVALLVDVFMLGMVSFMTVYGLVRLHRVEWSNAVLLAIFVLPVLRYSRLIYRRLGR